jgi:hypothetical protein
MASDRAREGWSTARFTCPVCKQPVPAVATRRRKVFGAYVPVWEPGPCENPGCPLNAESREELEPREKPESRGEDGPAVGPKEHQPR